MKSSIPIYLAVEDDLSEWVVRRALSTRPVAYAIGAVFGRTGFGYLRKQAPAFNNAAKRCPFLLLTDLDQSACAPLLIAQWLARPRHPRFLLRVAVREVEAWLLGDDVGLCSFLGLRKKFTCPNPEQLADPKAELLKAAMDCPRRSLREAIVCKDERSGRLLQGPDYNGALAGFVTKQWNIGDAGRKCRSLDRFCLALERLERNTPQG